MLLILQMCDYAPSKYFQLSAYLFVLDIPQHQISHQQFLELLIVTHKGLLAGEVKGMQSATKWNYAQCEIQILATIHLMTLHHPSVLIIIYKGLTVTF